MNWIVIFVVAVGIWLLLGDRLQKFSPIKQLRIFIVILCASLFFLTIVYDHRFNELEERIESQATPTMLRPLPTPTPCPAPSVQFREYCVQVTPP